MKIILTIFILIESIISPLFLKKNIVIGDFYVGTKSYESEDVILYYDYVPSEKVSLVGLLDNIDSIKYNEEYIFIVQSSNKHSNYYVIPIKEDIQYYLNDNNFKILNELAYVEKLNSTNHLEIKIFNLNKIR